MAFDSRGARQAGAPQMTAPRISSSPATRARKARPCRSSNELTGIRATHCTRYRYRYSECRRCADACPHEAIELTDEGVSVSDADCRQCALCAAACPTEALTVRMPRQSICCSEPSSLARCESPVRLRAGREMKSCHVLAHSVQPPSGFLRPAASRWFWRALATARNVRTVPRVRWRWHSISMVPRPSCGHRQ